MSYNKRGYYIRVEAVKAITARHYQPERHDRCYRWVWRRYIHPAYGISYQTYLSYLKVKPENSENVTQLNLFD